MKNAPDEPPPLARARPDDGCHHIAIGLVDPGVGLERDLERALFPCVNLAREPVRAWHDLGCLGAGTELEHADERAVRLGVENERHPSLTLRAAIETAPLAMKRKRLLG